MLLKTRAFQFAALGAVLALGAPLGWLLLRMLTGALEAQSVPRELAHHAGLYAYLLGGCLVAFVAFGASLGVLADRLAAADALHARESITDALTGLYNPRYFHRRLGEEIARADRTGRPLGLVMLDLDHFKRLNDRYGHQTGDLALMRVGGLIQEACRASDIACRIGGEEFALLCPETGVDTAHALADRLRQAFEHLGVTHGGEAIPVTASLGVGEWIPGETAEALFERVDAALYEAKTHGRNRVERTPSDPQVHLA